jgi:hypothetical protein
MTVRWQQVR